MPQIVLQKPTPFSQSRIWQFQRDYFNAAGIDAWRTGEVPHYLTSNPVVGKTYAELVLAFLRDLSLRGQQTEPVYLLELGAGHGRLCYHFFKHFEKYYEQSAIPLPPFCYVLSDFTESNLRFWEEHARLQPYFSHGWLDFALFDVENSQELSLKYRGTTIQAGSLAQPIVVIANYFFDTIPQELFLIQDGDISNVFLSLSSEADPSTLETAALIAALQLEYNYQPATIPIYPNEPILNDLLESYRPQFEHTHLLFPDVGIRCLERLRQLSQQGLVLITADKGQHHLSNLDQYAAPQLATHGSFSLTVNYHAFQQYCTQQGGLSFFPHHEQASLDLGCLLLLPDAESYRETTQAYERFVSDYGPDDFFTLKKLIEPHLDRLSCEDILGMIRWSSYDARIFCQMLPRLFEIVPEISESERLNLLMVIPRIWDTYYPLGESENLANDLGNLLLILAFYHEALLFFEKSALIYGNEADTTYKLALCHCMLGQFSVAAPMIEELKALAPNNEALISLIKIFETELAKTQTE